MQATKETELLKVRAAWRTSFNKIHDQNKDVGNNDSD